VEFKVDVTEIEMGFELRRMFFAVGEGLLDCLLTFCDDF
jgi:hypothetical protein